MSTLQIESERWTEYFDHLSNAATSLLIKVEILSLAIGDQVEAEDAEFNGITYDKHNDIITVLAGSLGHIVSKPIRVYVLEENESLKSIEITDVTDTKHVLSFKELDHAS